MTSVGYLLEVLVAWFILFGRKIMRKTRTVIMVIGFTLGGLLVLLHNRPLPIGYVAVACFIALAFMKIFGAPWKHVVWVMLLAVVVGSSSILLSGDPTPELSMVVVAGGISYETFFHIIHRH